MNLRRLKLHNFRNFNTLDLSFAPGLNIITGLNGSGKTSILEAIYLLASGRSFRSSNVSKLINFGSDFLAVYSEFHSSQDIHSNLITTVGYKKSKKEGTVLKLDEKCIHSLSEVARVFPVNCLDGAFFRALSEESQYRRKIFDWGVFHVKHSFYSAWKKYNEVLKQRNILLKSRVGIGAIHSWNSLFADAAIAMIGIRKEYIKELTPYFDEYMGSFLSIPHRITLTFNHGLEISSRVEIIAKLEENFSRDLERGFTSFGPHRADLVFRCEEGHARDVLSRGQQKILLLSFFLAQIKLLRISQEKSCTVLLDDLASELDNDVLDRMYKHLYELDHQLIITAINSSHFPIDAKIKNIITLDK